MQRLYFIDRNARGRISGTSLLRSYQLRELALQRLDDLGLRADVAQRFTHAGALLVFNKNALTAIRLRHLAVLRALGNRIIGDPVDGEFEPERLRLCHRLMASSYSQLAAFQLCFPDIPSDYVGHHVDVRIPEIAPPEDRARIGYFGELSNARHRETIWDRVAFILTDTSRAQDCAWMDRLKEFNVHYLIRAPGPNSVLKPFTKGFIAAHCGAPAIVDKADGEARHFLPDDYPYFVDGASERDVRAMLSRVTTEFSSVSWRYAQSAMAKIKQRQSRDAIASQFASAAEAELLLLGGRPPLSPAPPDLIL